MWLNLELAKKLESCIEYVILHELLHFIEEKHSEKFTALLNKYMPKWKKKFEIFMNKFISQF
ncbi:MAG: M48 family metallopeptidase [Candidatus Peregrinibacteria bacterium]|nr:M48 family metallopeptidase [Candidatus Peregrinibacteria bacterium]